MQAANKQVAASGAAIRQAQANVRSAQASTVAAQVNLNFKRVVAPNTGVVGYFPVKVGDYVNTGQTITTLTQNDSRSGFSDLYRGGCRNCRNCGDDHVGATNKRCRGNAVHDLE
ncbi:hypothetical protein [Nostoc sp.]|uniref:hypothetical protein n=1 Tax=Nostoc sp. TaxID=1180 RepID=UPI002FF52BF0